METYLKCKKIFNQYEITESVISVIYSILDCKTDIMSYNLEKKKILLKKEELK